MALPALTIWKESYYPNIGGEAGLQTVPQTIGLANGTFLTVWEDDTNGPGAFTDIMGRIQDAEGNNIGPIFQINSAVTASNETGPKIKAMPDGGFVVAYGSYLEAIGGFIAIERFDANGNEVASRFITDEHSSLTAWDLTVDGAGNYTIVYELLADETISADPVLSINIHATTYDHLTNGVTVDDAWLLAQNSHEDDLLAAVASFINGDIVTFYREPDYDFFDHREESFEFSITNNLTGGVIHAPMEIAQSGTGLALDVAVLAGGQFVMLYSTYEVIGNFYYLPLAFKIGSGDSASATIGDEVRVIDFFDPAGDPSGLNSNARVIGVGDGGFLVVWEANHVLKAARFNADGTAIGSTITVTAHAGVGAGVLGDLSLTTDGRVLVPFVNDAGEIAQVILDTRSDHIYGTSGNDVLTTQTFSTSVNGGAGNDTILGRGGDDTIAGDDGADTLKGGNGDDRYILFDVHRPDITSFFRYDAIFENANGGIDTVYVIRKTTLVSGYTLATNVENGFIEGTDNFSLNGNASDNFLVGNAAQNSLIGFDGNDLLAGGAGNDYLDGGKGNDELEGGQGADTLIGGRGRDTLSYDTAGDLVINLKTKSVSGDTADGDIISRFENVTGGSGDDRLTGNNAANYLNGGAGNDKLTGGLGVDMLLGGVGRDKFIFKSIADSGLAQKRDIVEDFSHAEHDRINLRTIDASTSTPGNQAFTLVRDSTFTAEGQVRVKQSGADTIVFVNTTGSGGAEMSIVLHNVNAALLVDGDFLL